MRKSSISFLLVLFAAASAFAASPAVPGTNDVVRYELLGHKIFPRERGDSVLSAFDGGRQLQERQSDSQVGIAATYKIGTNVICMLPVPPRDWLNLTLTNGSVYSFGIGDGFVDLPEGCYEIKDAARIKINKLMSQSAEDLRQETINASKPLVYVVGTVNDGGTLSRIAHLFYGDARKWQKIYEATGAHLTSQSPSDAAA